jgi:hypothetical protein
MDAQHQQQADVRENQARTDQEPHRHAGTQTADYRRGQQDARREQEELTTRPR